VDERLEILDESPGERVRDDGDRRRLPTGRAVSFRPSARISSTTVTSLRIFIGLPGERAKLTDR
jgi:hypothetical protein